MLSVRNLVKTYQTKKADTVVALNNVSIDFPETGLVFLLGKSGSGKSTLLNAIGGLDTFDSGEIIIKGKSSKDFSQSDFDSYRNTFIGFIFQEYNILENFSVQKNLALAIELQGKKPDKAEIDRLLEQVEMTQYAKRKPNQLSGGQKQRVAIARALVKNPEIIMADEPTGALDSNTGKQVMETLKNLSKTKLVIIVSHDREFAEIYGDRIIELKDGHIISDVTKKEIEAQSTQSGIKIIDDSIVYIKKGQEISEKDMKAIVKIINDNSTKGDTFISFDKKGNDALKKGAKITDDGNKEAFIDTQAEDIKVKAYNGNSLKLIKSHLKFADSFKMGASALKNKVGKLVFTILLSFFAFTVFGIIDALSCWNRADSVYQAMTMQNKTHMAMMKYNKGSYDNPITSVKDVSMIQNEFKNYIVRGVVGTGYGTYDTQGERISLQDYTFIATDNVLKKPNISGYVYFTKEELENKLGFTIEGRLPAADNEIAVSKFLMNAMIKNTENQEKKVESFDHYNPEIPGTTPLEMSMYAGGGGYSRYEKYTIVGVVDDKTDLSKYETMSEEELSKNRKVETEIHFGYSRLAYVSKNIYESLMKNAEYARFDVDFGVKDDYSRMEIEYLKSIETVYDEQKYDYERYQNNSNNWWNFEEDRLYTYEEMLQRYDNDEIDYIGSPHTYNKTYESYLAENIKYIKGGLESRLQDGKLVLADDEIIVSNDFISAYAEDIYQSKIDGGIKVRFKPDYYGKEVAAELTIVGVSKNNNYYANEKVCREILKPAMTGYTFMVSKLNGTDEDKEFIKYLETYNANDNKFAVQGATTGTLDILDEILDMMTSVFVWVALGFAIFASLMLMNFISTSISYKKREIGVLRALGARGSDIFGIFFNESMIIAMINFVLATIATFIACSCINAAVLAKLPVEIVLLNVSIRQMALILGVSVASAFVGSFLPTFKISRKKPIDAINNR